MQSKQIVRLLILFTAPFILSFQCNKNCYESQYGVTFVLVTNDSTFLFDSISNLTENQVVWRYDSINSFFQGDTLNGFLEWNPERAQTTFITYSSTRIDTLILNYQYEQNYSECEDYFFHLKYINIESSTANVTQPYPKKVLITY